MPTRRIYKGEDAGASNGWNVDIRYKPSTSSIVVKNGDTEQTVMNTSGSTLTSATGAIITKIVPFVENATSTTHTGTIAIPAGAWLHDIRVTSSVLWTGGTATMKVGDTADDDGYFIGVNLKATDLLVGEVLAINDSTKWGGKEGAY